MYPVSSRTHYEVLGVSATATTEEIKVAFRRLAVLHHPDRNPGDSSAEAKFKEANEAFQVLSDDQKRAVYDFDAGRANDLHRIQEELRKNDARRAAAHAQQSNPFAGTRRTKNVEDIFETLFGNQNPFTGSQARINIEDFARERVNEARRSAPSTEETFSTDADKPGDDIVMEVVVSFDESIHGCQKPVHIKGPRPNVPCSTCSGTGGVPGARKVSCPNCAGHGKAMWGFEGLRKCTNCNGTGNVPLAKCKTCNGLGKQVYIKDVTVKIPAGIADGQQLRLAGQGCPGSPPGNLLIKIRVKKDEKFWRENNDLHTKLTISLQHAMLGGKASFTKGDQSEVTITIPAGTQPGEELRIADAGVKGVISKTAGNLVVHIEVEIPKLTTDRGKKLFEELMSEIQRHPRG